MTPAEYAAIVANPLNPSLYRCDVTPAQYAGILAAINGLYPRKVAEFQALAQTAAIPTLLTYTPSADGVFQLSGWLNIIATAGSTISLISFAWTDTNNNAQALGVSRNGSTSGTYTTATPFALNVCTIRAKGGTAITLAVALGGAGGLTYDIGGTLNQLSA